MKPINSLTATRGLAALLVVIFHYGCTVFPFSLAEHFFRSGNLAVNYFFVLSGFVMYRTYSTRHITYKDFIRRRFARIYPAYLLAIILAVIPVLYGWVSLHTPIEGKFTTGLLLNLGLLQAYIPGYALTVNSPGWSLSVEMFFYILFPLLLAFQLKNTKRFVWIAAAVYLTTQLIHFWLIDSWQPVYPSRRHEFIYYHPVFHLNLFMVGMCGAYVMERVKKLSSNFAALLVFAVIVLLINYMPSGISMHNGLLAPLFLLLIVLIAGKDPRLLNAAPLVFLGEISYGIYILQEPVHYYIYHFNEDYLHLGGPAFFYLYLAILLLCSAISYRLVELPLRNWLNKGTPRVSQPL